MTAKLCSILLCVVCGSILAADTPNPIVILADNLGYGEVGCFGAKDIRTPNLDRMAAEGRAHGDRAQARRAHGDRAHFSAVDMQ